MQYFLRYELLSHSFGLATDRRTESDAYEPTVQCAQVGSKQRHTWGLQSCKDGSKFVAMDIAFSCDEGSNKYIILAPGIQCQNFQNYMYKQNLIFMK